MEKEEHYLKKKIRDRGFMFSFVATKIDVRPEELSMWLSEVRKMPKNVEIKILKFLDEK